MPASLDCQVSIVYTLGMKTAINIKADTVVKKKAQKLAEELGLTLSAVVNASLKEFIRNQSVSFSTVPRMSKRLERIIAEAERDLKVGKNISPIFNSAEDAIRYLRL